MSPIDGEALLERFDPQAIVLVGLVGLFVCGVLLMIFIFRRLLGVLGYGQYTISRRRSVLAGVRNLVLFLFLTLSSGMLLFLGLFFQTYHRFSLETPVADIVIHPITRSETADPLALVHFRPAHNGRERFFFIHGDQWMIEGDILKWKPWLNLLGLDPRFRLTRISGRYHNIQAEKTAPRSVFSLLVSPQNSTVQHSFWRFLYRSGHHLPLVDTVYGNAAYHNMDQASRYKLYVSHTGFVARAQTNGAQDAGQSKG